MAMLTTNYNVMQVSAADEDKYCIGNFIIVPIDADWRMQRFHKLEIKGITFGFGIFLHVDWVEWERNKQNAAKRWSSYLENIPQNRKFFDFWRTALKTPYIKDIL